MNPLFSRLAARLKTALTAPALTVLFLGWIATAAHAQNAPDAHFRAALAAAPYFITFDAGNTIAHPGTPPQLHP